MATTIRTGETAPQVTVAQMKEKDTHTYYHMVPGARFVMPDGLEVRFMGGQFTTQDKEIITELDKVVNRATSMIYTKSEAIQTMLEASKISAADAVQKLAPNT